MMASNLEGQAYEEAVTAITGLHQRFQYGFGGYIEVLLTLLQKQHYQAAADIVPLINKEKVCFEAQLLEYQSLFETKANRAEFKTIKEEMADGSGTFSGEAADSGKAPPSDGGPSD